MSDNVVPFNRQPVEIPQPQAVTAEKALLGACLHDAGAFDVASDIVNARHFFEPAHQRIWAAMEKGRLDGRPLDFRLVIATLGGTASEPLSGLGMTVGQYVAHLVAEAVSVSDAPYFARAIVDAAAGRHIASVTADLHDALNGGMSDPAEVATDAIERLDAVVQGRARTATPRIMLGAAVAKAMEASRLASEGKAPRGAPTGLRSLDRALSGGLLASNFYVMAGRPGMGKTMLALEVAKGAARSGVGVMFVSLEMDAIELSQRSMSSELYRQGRHLSYQDIAMGSVPGGLDDAFERAYEALERLPLVIEQQPGLTMGQIASRARQARNSFQRAGIKFGLIVTDHIGLIAPSPAYRGNRTGEVTEISIAHKAMAKEFGVPVIGLSQLNRQVESRDDKRPGLSDLRDSGSLEQDADAVIFPFREAYYLAKQKELDEEEAKRLLDRERVMEIHIAKQRGGPECRFDAYCDPAVNVVCELDRGRQ
jgi:replicative DNA helicase